MPGSDPLAAADTLGGRMPARSTRRTWAASAAGQISIPVPGQIPAGRPRVRLPNFCLPGARLRSFRHPGARLPGARHRQPPVGADRRLVSVRPIRPTECRRTGNRATGPRATRIGSPGIGDRSLAGALCHLVRRLPGSEPAKPGLTRCGPGLRTLADFRLPGSNTDSSARLRTWPPGARPHWLPAVTRSRCPQAQIRCRPFSPPRGGAASHRIPGRRILRYTGRGVRAFRPNPQTDVRRHSSGAYACFT